MKVNDFYLTEPTAAKPIENYQTRILHELMYHTSLSFNQLWNKEGRSNKFAYHLKKLEDDGFIRKNKESKYQLTTKGKRRVVYLESFTGNRCELPVVAVITVVMDKDRVLLIHRKKEPFFGYWAAHGGKLRSTNYIMEQAKETLKKETGFVCDLELKGLFSSRSHIDGDFSYGHQLFIIKATNPQGELIEKTKKGTNKWFKKNEIQKLRILPNIPHLLRITEGKGFRWIEADRFEVNDNLDLKIRKDITI